MGTVIISGASGFLGSALASSLRARGQRVRPLVRPGKQAEDGIAWDPRAGTIDAHALEGADAVVHLAGESIAGRWTEARKAELEKSRLSSTSLLSRTLSSLTAKPRVFVSASAIGFYGDRGASPVDERDGPGTGFLPELSVAWERAAAPAATAGIRVVHPRFGVVLDPSGGALKTMLLPFKLGLGGRLGAGTQMMSWVSLADTISALSFLLETEGAKGPYNVTAPAPVSNAEFTDALGQALHRPTVLPMPAPMMRLAFGEMADAALLSGARVLPTRLLEAGFRFEHPALAPFLALALR